MDNLTMDAIAARAAGMSYGKYMGLRYEKQQAEKTEEERAREERRARKAEERAALIAQQNETAVNGKWIDCVWCGRLFFAAGTRKLCSEACKEARQFEVGKRSYYRKRGVPVPPEVEQQIEERKREMAVREDGC